MSIRALGRRVAKMESAWKPRASPFVRWYGSFDNFLDEAILPGYLDGKLDQNDILNVVAALSRWETDGTWSGIAKS